MSAEAALGTAPEVVGEAEGRDRGNVGTVGDANLPADERQSEPVEVDPERATGVERVAQLPCAVQEPLEVAAGAAVTKRQLHLPKAKTGPGRVDGHAHLAAEAGRHREACGPRPDGQRALSGERLARLDPGQELDEEPGRALRDAEAAADVLGEHGDAEVGGLVQKRGQFAGKIRIAGSVGRQIARTDRRGPLCRRQRLAFPPAREPQHDGPGVLRNIGGAVAGAVVSDDHLGVGERTPKRLNRLTDHRLLVSCRDENRQRLTHPSSS